MQQLKDAVLEERESKEHTHATAPRVLTAAEVAAVAGGPWLVNN